MEEISVSELIKSFVEVRQSTIEICRPLVTEDYVVQPIPQVSPPKWHLAHTTWFFEEMILVPFLENYKRFNDNFNLLFNSYYKAAGKHWLQAERGQLSRPTVSEIKNYRQYVEDFIEKLLNMGTQNEKVLFLLELGIHHEQQHQELLLMDIKYILGTNIELPTYRETELAKASKLKVEWFSIDEGVYEIGHKDKGFSYDNELPCHKSYLQKSEIRTGLITNGEYLEFIESRGYEKAELWLSLGWDWVNDNDVKAPLYWIKKDEKYFEFTLNGIRELDLNAPVAHISYFEADAFSRWSGHRLPTEQELEIFESKSQIKGELWCWTSSHYSPYPGFKNFEGAIGEYNGKFMCNQFVLRGGCSATPKNHYRETYRNFYPPHERWMFSGIRIARN